MIPRCEETERLVTILCPKHQQEPWSGFMTCTKCGKLYHYEAAPVYCQCGAFFRVEVDTLFEWLVFVRYDHSNFTTGRLVCFRCAQERMN